VPTLVVTGGPLDGTAFPLPPAAGATVVGSSAAAGVRIELGNVEPFHARLVVDATGLAIEDAGSGTGTFVNGERVAGLHALQNGDRVCLGPPGAKGSARLLVFLPAGAAGDSPPFGAEGAVPTLVDAPMPSLGEERPALAFAPSDEPGVPQEFDLSAGGGPVAESVVVDDEASGPLLEAIEVPPPPEGDAFFTSPLPPAPPSPPAAVPPPPPPPAPAPPRPAAERLTAPPPPEHARAEAPKPEYLTELPSIPVERPPEPAAPAEFPSLRPAPRPAARPARGRGRARRRAFALPSLPVLPILGGAAGLVAVGGLAWFFFMRGTPPEIASATPDRAEPGQAVTLAGRHFAEEPSGNSVRFGSAKAQVSEASSSALKVVVPAGVNGPVPVVVETKGGRSEAVTITVQAAARATALEPDVALPGQVVLVRGEGFQGQRLSAQVAGIPAAAVETTAEGARVTIPAVGLPEGSKTFLALQSGNSPPKSFDLFIGRLPLVLEVTPERGPLGERVVLAGRGFLPDPRFNTVAFGGQPALVLSASATELTVIAPAPPPDVLGELPIVVTVAGRSSAANATYAVLRPALSSFVPRFFAAPVTEAPGEPFVFVSTELGPVLLFGGRADAPSTAERALRVSAALNALVDGAPSRPPAFELRERPQLAVGVVGDVRPFLVPTTEDVAAYSRNWETGRGAGRRVSPPALARHWAALLQDYFGLFLHRQRPLQMAALSPRGKVLTEIYAEASRRSPGGTGVPVSLVLPTAEGMATALRQLALVVSGEAGRAAVAVEGRWDGTIEDPELGTRRFELALRTEGGRLAGTLTTFRGGIELRATVRDIGFDRGNVRFTADQQGTAYQFKGALEGNTVTGTIERAGKPPAKFTLQFVE
jgi:hypothetical protein